ncbi:uncharacterized protein LOC141612699 [Silene latifolia]|uniref:uncharacterized protein LOC141612699 n=1 Tax=Silene latifolia TaxID=37657 RepID=UPI003D776109
MGLNGGYDTIRSQILSMDPLPSINKALGLFQKIERQKHITYAVNSLTEASAYASYKHSDNKKTASDDTTGYKYCDHCEKKGHTRETCFGLNRCPHCKKFGHNPANCFVVKGYPFDKNKGKAPITSGSVSKTNQVPKSTGSGVVQRAANIAETTFESPLDDKVLASAGCSASSKEQGHTPNISSDVLNGIISTVIDQVIQRISDQQIGLSSSQFLGPFKLEMWLLKARELQIFIDFQFHFIALLFMFSKLFFLKFYLY